MLDGDDEILLIGILYLSLEKSRQQGCRHKQREEQFGRTRDLWHVIK